VPFLKFSRDKRGYENYYLFEGKGRPRLLFWFRTAPNLKLGRAPFSEDVRKMVESQNPDVQFDWARIMSTPIPSADVEYWRERRRTEKAAKRAAREAEAAEAAEAATGVAEAGAAEVAATAEVDSTAEVEADVEEEFNADPTAVAEEETGTREDLEAVAEAVAEAETPAAASEGQSTQPQGHRRRRRRRRGRRGGGGPGGPPPAPESGPAQGGEV
jgi:hypothetical protein